MIDGGPLLLEHREVRGKSSPQLRIAIVTGPSPELWIRELIELFRAVPSFHVSVFGTEEKSPDVSIPGLTARLYRFSRQRFDPFASATVASSETAEAEAIPRACADVLVWLAPEAIRPPSYSNLARFGALTVELGEGRTAPPYSAEVLDRHPVSTAVVYWHESSWQRARVVRSAETSTLGGWFFTRNAQEPLIAIARMLAGVALDIAMDGKEWIERALKIPEVEPRRRSAAYPSNIESAAFITRQTVRSLRLRLQARGRRFTWFTAIRRRPALFYSNTGRFSNDELEDIPAPPGSEMADPFLLEHDGKTWLFYEDVPAGSSKGRLSCLQIEPNGFSAPAVVLDKDFHLSYPCVFEERGDIFMLPETSENGTVQLFHARRFPFEFEPVAILMEGVRLVDTTPFLHDGRWYFFTTTTQPFMETFLFFADRVDGRWRMHPSSPISSSVKSSRSAGRLFYWNGRLLRPTQDCSVRYGYGMTINQITRLTTTEFEEERADFIGPGWRAGLLGTHTLNSTPTAEVVDGIRYAK